MLDSNLWFGTDTIQRHINERVERYVHVSMSGTEPHGVRPSEVEACELGKDCSEEEDPAALSNGKEKSAVY